MKAMMKVAALIAGAAFAACAASAQTRPVTVQADPELDACPSTGVVSGLNPRGDNFLSVRAAPRAGAREVGRLRTRQVVFVCDTSAGQGWWGVVYPRVRGRNCRLSTRLRRHRAYAGPCRSGWVATRYVTLIGG